MDRCLLFAYRFLLQLYPPAFRQRFAPEMLELAQAAEPTEWPLIFGDTSLAIVRCWLEPARSSSTVAPAGPDFYPAIGRSPLTALRLVQGLVLSVAIILGLWYVTSQFPTNPPCRQISTELVPTTPLHTSPLTTAAKESILRNARR
jgi:hypothetical protein